MKQFYFCKDCQRKFTTEKVKNRTYPGRVITDGISLYNLGYTLEESGSILRTKHRGGVGRAVRPDGYPFFDS